MKKLLLLSVLFASLNVCIAQKRIKLTEYPASNGINYKLGDKVKMYKGSGANGNFVNLYLGGWGALAYGKLKDKLVKDGIKYISLLLVETFQTTF
jgi:hypothetical protein